MPPTPTSLARRVVSSLLDAEREPVTLNTQAKAGERTYPVRIEYRGEKPVLRIVGTPGSWYLDTFMSVKSSALAIDAGQGWACTNVSEIQAEITQRPDNRGGDGHPQYYEPDSDRRWRQFATTEHCGHCASDLEGTSLGDLAEMLVVRLPADGWEMRGERGAEKYEEARKLLVKAHALLNQHLPTNAHAERLAAREPRGGLRAPGSDRKLGPQ